MPLAAYPYASACIEHEPDRPTLNQPKPVSDLGRGVPIITPSGLANTPSPVLHTASKIRTRWGNPDRSVRIYAGVPGVAHGYARLSVFGTLRVG